MWTSFALVASLLLLGVAAAAAAAVTISHQGPVYWAVPLYIADQLNYWEDLDLSVTYDVYSSGAPQVEAAVESKAWDIGAAGVVPNAIAGPQDIDTIGISNDESATNALVATSAGVGAWPPESIADVPIYLTGNSTVHYAVEACLVAQEFNLADVDFTFATPDEVLESLQNGTTDYGGLWAPNLYLFLESSEDSKVLCSGEVAEATVPGGIMVRKEFGEANPEIVAKVLAAWLRGIEFIKDPDNRGQVLTYMAEYYESYNVSISEDAMGQDIDMRPIFGLDEQLNLMERTDGANSTVDGWYSGVSQFMFNAGVLSEDPAPDTYITDKYLQLVANDSELRLFALGQNETEPTEPTSAATTDGAKWATYSVMASGAIIVFVVGFM